MGFLQTSTVTNTTVNRPTAIGDSASDLLLQPVTIDYQKNAASASQSIDQVLASAKSNSAAATIVKASDYLRSAIQSTISTFDKTTNSLASGISAKLANVFKNTNVASGSTVSTRISDPVSTNLLSGKKPTATSFKVTSIDGSSQAVAGSKTIAGTGAGQMTGTSLTTLLTRVKADISAVSNLPNLLANRVSSERMNGLFNTVASKSNIGSTKTSSLSLKSLVSATLGTNLTKTLGTGAKTTSVSANDLSAFTGSISGVSQSLGNKDLSGYYMTNSGYSLTNAQGTPVYTNQSGVDASTANAILGMLRNIGCSVRTDEYLSANQIGSLFGLGLLLAALEGMVDLVEDLLKCSHASTALGQQAISSAFLQSSGSQLDIANSILDKADAPYSLNTPDLGISILSNPNLSAANKTTVDAMFDKLGTTTKDAYTVPNASSSRYPVYDASLLPKVNSGFTNAVFQTSALTDYINGTRLGVGSNGKLVYA